MPHNPSLERGKQLAATLTRLPYVELYGVHQATRFWCQHETLISQVQCLVDVMRNEYDRGVMLSR